MNLGELYLLTGKLDSAQLLLDQAALFFKRVNNQTALYYIDTQQLALALKKGQTAKAAAIIRKVYETPIDPSLIDIRKKQMEQYYAQTHDFQNAYLSLKEKNRPDDSIRNERIWMRVAEIDMRYKQDSTLMKQTIFIQKQQNDMNTLRQTTYIWIAVCIILILVFIQVFLYTKKQKAYMQMKYKNRVAELKMENIRNRISPHFIFNTLNRAISHKEMETEKEEELKGLVKLLRQKKRDENRSSGTGLKVLTQTIQLLNEYNKEQINISIHNIQTTKGETGYEVTFTLPDNYSHLL